MSGEAISEYELESERKHNDSAVKHEEYDSDTEELFEKLEKFSEVGV